MVKHTSSYTFIILHHPSSSAITTHHPSSSCHPTLSHRYAESREHRDLYLTDEVALYVHTVLPAVTDADADARPFVDTSPSNGVVSSAPYVKRWGWTSTKRDASAGAWGDIHYYNYQACAVGGC